MTNKRVPLPPDSQPCPCGALAEKPNVLCRKCRARTRWSRRKQRQQAYAPNGYDYRIERRAPDRSWHVIETGSTPSFRDPAQVARGLLERRVLDRADRRLGGMAIVDDALAVQNAYIRVTVLDPHDRTALAVAALAPVQARRRVPRQRRSMNNTRRSRKEGSR